MCKLCNSDTEPMPYEMHKNSMRKSLIETMKDLKEGRCSVRDAQAVSKLASQIVYSVRIELEEKRLQLKHNRSVPANMVTTSIPNIKL